MVNLIQKGRDYATKAHEGQTRKTSGEPYIGHPIQVALILHRAGMSPEDVVAGHLHDVVEDTNITLEEIRAEFGNEIADLVAYNTEDKTKSWEDRKSHTIEQLKTGTLREKALVVADKYANLMELARMYAKHGEGIWDYFKRGKQQQYWYFAGVATSGKMNLTEDEIPEFFHKYTQLVNSFFNKGSVAVEVIIDYKQHESVPALVQTFINANTGAEINQHELENMNVSLRRIFTDSVGRKVMVFNYND